MSLTEYASKARPMSTYECLLEESKKRYEPGTGPWSKKPGDLDQIDLIYLEDLAEGYKVLSCERGLMSGCIESLVAEVRQARDWPTPPRIEPAFEYVDNSESTK